MCITQFTLSKKNWVLPARPRENPQKLLELERDKFGLPSFWPKNVGVKDRTMTAGIMVANVTQARKNGFAPGADFYIDAEQRKVWPIQVDLLFEGYQLQQLETSWISDVQNLSGSDGYKTPFVAYLTGLIDARARIEEEHRETSREFNGTTQEQTPKYRGNDKRETGAREQSQSNINGSSNIHNNSSIDNRGSNVNIEQAVQQGRLNNLSYNKEVENDSTRTSIKPRTPTRESTQYKAYINSRQTRIGIYTDTTKRANSIRAKYQEYNNQQSAVCEAVAPRISANDEDRERSLLIKARENYRAFESFKRIAERVTERVREIGEKIIQTGSRIANFFNGRANERAERAEQERLKRDTEQHKSKVRDYGHYSSR